MTACFKYALFQYFPGVGSTNGIHNESYKTEGKESRETPKF